MDGRIGSKLICAAILFLLCAFAMQIQAAITITPGGTVLVNGIPINDTPGDLNFGTDDVFIADTGNLLIDAGSTLAAGNVFGDDAGDTALTVTGVGSQLVLTGFGNRLEHVGTGVWQVLNGAVLDATDTANCSPGTCNLLFGAFADMVVSGAGSQLNHTGDLILGEAFFSGALSVEPGDDIFKSLGDLSLNPFNATSATLVISNGGAVNSGNALVSNGDPSGPSITDAVATVTGAGSIWNVQDLRVASGASATASVVVELGGAVSAAGDTVVADALGTTASVIVRTAGNLTTGNLAVGSQGNGTISLVAGGTLNTSSADFGVGAGRVGSIAVNGTGSILIADDLTLGVNGNGAATLFGGGAATITNRARLAGQVGGSGALAVTGPGSSFTADRLDVGFAANGIMNVQAGGALQIGRTLEIGNSPTGVGTATINASTATIGDDLVVGRDGGIGTLSLLAGANVDVGGQVDGDLLGNIAIIGFAGGDGTLTMDAATINVLATDGGTPARLHIGDGGTGSATLLNGASLTVENNTGGTSNGAILGVSTADGAGIGALTLDGSTLTLRGLSSTLDLGEANSANSGAFAGEGTLTLLNNSAATLEATGGAARLTLGAGALSRGTVTVDASTLDVLGDQVDVLLGHDGNGAVGDGVADFAITNGGSVNVRGADSANTRFAVGLGTGAATLRVDDGGTLTIDGALAVSQPTADNATQTGLVQLDGSGTINADTVVIGAGGTLQGNGTLITSLLQLQTGADFQLESIDSIASIAIEGVAVDRTETLDFNSPVGESATVSGGSLSTQQNLRIGTDSGASGEVQLSGGALLDVGGEVVVGGGTQGMLNLTGGSIATVGTQLTLAANGEVSAAGIGTALNANSFDATGGRMTMTDGATLQLAGDLSFAGTEFSADSAADVRVAGSGSAVQASNLALANGSTLQIANNLTLDGASTLNVTTGADLSVNDTSVRNGSQLNVLDAATGFSANTLLVDAAALHIDNDVTLSAGTLNVANGGTISGNGTLDADVTIGANSLLGAGNSSGALDITGNLVLDGGALEFEIGGTQTGQFDVVTVQGDANLQDGEITLSLINGFEPGGSDSFDVMSVAGTLSVDPGVALVFDGLGPDFLFEFTNDGEVNIGTISLLAVDIAGTPQLSGNEQTLAQLVDDLCPRIEGLTDPTEAEADLDMLCGALRQADNTPEQIANALDAISPEEVLGAVDSLLRFTTVQHGNLSRRLNGLRSGAARIDLSNLNLQTENVAINGGDVERLLGRLVGGAAGSDHEDFARWGFFSDGGMNFGDRDTVALNSGYDFGTMHLTFGADYRVTDQLFVGAALGYSEVDADFDVGGGLAVESTTLTLMATYFKDDRYYLDMLATYGVGETDIDRAIAFDTANDSVRRGTQASTDTAQLALGIGGGYDFTIGRWVHGPHLGANYSEVAVDAANEQGAGGLDLVLPDQVSRSRTANVGWHVSYTMTPSWGVVVPYARLDWVKDFEAGGGTEDVAFVNDRFRSDPLDPTRPARLQVDDMDTSYAVWSVGAHVQLVHGIAAFVNYRSTAAFDDFALGEVTAGIRFERSF